MTVTLLEPPEEGLQSERLNMKKNKIVPTSSILFA